MGWGGGAQLMITAGDFSDLHDPNESNNNNYHDHHHLFPWRNENCSFVHLVNCNEMGQGVFLLLANVCCCCLDNSGFGKLWGKFSWPKKVMVWSVTFHIVDLSFCQANSMHCRVQQSEKSEETLKQPPTKWKSFAVWPFTEAAAVVA